MQMVRREVPAVITLVFLATHQLYSGTLVKPACLLNRFSFKYSTIYRHVFCVWCCVCTQFFEVHC